MEGNLSSGNMISSGGSFGGLDLQGSMRVHHHQPQLPLSLQQQHHSLSRLGPSMVHSSIHEGLPLTIGSIHGCDQTISLADYPKGERGKNSPTDEDEPSFTEDGYDGYNDSNRGKKGSPWHRVKWSDPMVRLLITAVSYIGEDASNEHGGGARRKYANLQKKGKWKSVSKVMAERGHVVSPQQCEDKFNDLNKRYKRLNEILGRGTSCEVVEHPELLDVMDHVTEKSKEEVRKILSSKHLFYEEMCSYHNGNRLHLPHDPELQRSLRLALRSRDDNENSDVRRHPQDDHDEDDQEEETDGRDENEDNHSLRGDHRGIYGVAGSSSKRTKHCQGHEDVGFGNSLNLLDCNKNFNSYPPNAHTDMNQVLPEKANLLQTQWIKHQSLQFEERKLQIQAETLELEKERFKWQRFCRKRDRELEMMRTQNERMRLENERMALELKRKEMGADHN